MPSMPSGQFHTDWSSFTGYDFPTKLDDPACMQVTRQLCVIGILGLIEQPAIHSYVASLVTDCKVGISQGGLA
jgi:hypothetical protein